MRRLGWVDGKNITYDWALGVDEEQRLPRLAAELVARKPDVIFAPPASAAIAARKATQSIPIVFATGTDPVGSGLVQSLAHPGGNVTGLISVVDSLAPKLVQLLREMNPHLKVIAYLGNPEDPRWRIDGEALASLDASGIMLVKAPISNQLQMSSAVEAVVKQGAQAIITVGSAVAFNLRDQLIQHANRHRIPVVAHRSELADSGALFSYGASLSEQIRLSARLVDRILKGQRPANIPVEQPNTFELVINRKTAARLGLTVPTTLLLRADRVIQ